MRLLHRFRVGAHGREIVVAAMILSLILAPEFFHGQHGVLHLGPAVREISTHNLRFFLKPASAHAEDKPTAGDTVQRGNLFSQHEWVVLGHQADTGAELNLAGYRRCPS